MTIKIAVLVLTIICVVTAQKYKKESSIGAAYFEEIRDTLINDQEVTVTHKKWTEFKTIGNGCPSADTTDKFNRSLIELNYHEVYHSNWPTGEGFRMDISATIWDYENRGYNKKRWNIHTVGTDLKIENGFFIVNQDGCCSHPGKIQYYSVKTGKYLTSFNSYAIYANLSIYNRYFGYVLYTYADSIYKKQENAKFNGIAFLFCDTSIISKVYVESNSSNSLNNDFCPRLKTDFKNSKHYMVLDFMNNKTIDLEVKNDTLIVVKGK